MRTLHRLPVFVVLAFAAVLPLCAQQSAQPWPPDDDFTGVQPQPIPSYSPTGQYNSATQPQYAQQQGQQGYQGSNISQQAYADTPQPPYAQQANGQQGYQQQPLSPDQLSQLVAPIAIYPDALIAQILAASTYPAQVSAADRWLQSMGNAAPEQIAAAADAQSSWDPSIKALTAFPQVLSMLDQNLQWTTSLGNAYYNQPQDILQTIQEMRQRAQQAGNLESNPEVNVSDNQGYIDIAPAEQQTVYVPSYNPWTVYGAPIAPWPNYSAFDAGFYGPSPVYWGFGFNLSSFYGLSWGWSGWGLDWFGRSVLYHHNDYCTGSLSVRDWGFRNGGPRAWARYPHSVHGGDNWRHGDSGHNGWGGTNGPGNGGGHNGNGGQSGWGGNNGPGGNSYPRAIGGPASHWGDPRTPDARTPDARTQEGFNRGFPPRNNTWGRPSAPTQQAFAGRQQFRGPQRPGQQIGGQQYIGQQYGGQQYGSRNNFNRQPYGSGNYASGPSAFPRDNHISRPGMAFSGGSSQNFRSPQYGANSFTGNRGGYGYSGSSNGGGHSNFSGGNFGGGHSFNGGGHFSSGGGHGQCGRHSFSGGGGHSSGGGGSHSSGGGGGHSSSGGGGHSSGGGHHH